MELMERQTCKNWWLPTRVMGLRAVLFVLLCQSFGVGLSAQLQHDYQWIFAFEDDTTSVLDFRNDTILIRKEFQDMKISFSNACISDADGNLLFYTNGCEIYDSSFKLMENGDGLNPGSVADSQCEFGYTAGHQSILILPSLGDSKIYHLFHKRNIIDANTEILIVTDTLFHTIVDLNLNNGLGAVVEKNKPINSIRLSNSFLVASKNVKKLLVDYFRCV